MVVDGTDLLENPPKWIIKLQDFLGLEKILDERNYVFDEEKGFFCVIRPYDKHKDCLRYDKILNYILDLALC